MTIRHCPTCGSGRIRRQTVTVTASIRGKRVRVPDLELELCPIAERSYLTSRPLAGWKSMPFRNGVDGR